MIDAQPPPIMVCNLSTAETQKPHESQNAKNRRDSGFSETPSPKTPSKPTHERRDSGISMMDEKHHHEESGSERYSSEHDSEDEHWDDHVYLRGGGGEGGQRELGEAEIERRMLEVKEEDEEGMVDDYGRPWVL